MDEKYNAGKFTGTNCANCREGLHPAKGTLYGFHEGRWWTTGHIEDLLDSELTEREYSRKYGTPFQWKPPASPARP